MRNALENITNYYQYLKETYIETTIERLSEISASTLFLWQSTGKIPMLKNSQNDIPELSDEQDHINWDEILNDNEDSLVDATEKEMKSSK